MLNLIKKDFMVQKKYILYFFPYSIIMVLVFSTSLDMAQSAYMAAAIGIIYMFIQYSCAIDDQNKSEKIFNSLPISRKKIVLSKYISIVLFSILSVIVVGLAGIIISTMNFSYMKVIKLEDIIAILSTGFVLTSLYLPVYFRFGYIKAKLFNTIVFFIFFFGPIMLINYLKKYANTSFIKSIIESITNQAPLFVGGIILSIAVMFLAISAIISTKIYYNREFN